MDQAFVKVMISEAVRIATLPFRIMPIKRNRIVFTGLTGGKNYDYSCNPRYVYEYLRDKYPGWFEYVWAVSDKNKYAFLEEEGVKLVKHFTVSSFPMLLTASNCDEWFLCTVVPVPEEAVCDQYMAWRGSL